MEASKLPWKRGRSALLCGVAVTAIALTAQQAAAVAEPSGSAGMNDAFTRAAAEYQVPRALLVAVGYGETHLDSHDGEPSSANGYGVMHLVSNPQRSTLEKASNLTGVPVSELRTNTASNIRGGAAVLRAYADALKLTAAERGDLAEWYPVVARYGGYSDATLARLYADTVYEIVEKGVRAEVEDGGTVVTEAEQVTPDRGQYSSVRSLDSTAAQSDDYPAAHWVPADSGNYASGRTAAIDTIVIHVAQGSYAGTISWFQDPAAESSAHYVIRSSDGDVTQMVRDSDTAWHAKSANSHSLGIEHEGYIEDASWFTDAMYNASAALVRHLTAVYGIPRDREHIVGHGEVPGNDHTDPGPSWDWDTYMALVNR
ncbi:N-acetylmuramoyl-L-alanine amidase [Streptomyces meridianus]|uniref:N-acetylmuramoyl-L-alanine amidase n=1 Tax=Streptomyces meridianus TaxID=2938945 RepID=UPI0027E2DA42|nr:N-acetylmuramoyl-L-alanine amidase [Streptomyces meridianus]